MIKIKILKLNQFGKSFNVQLKIATHQDDNNLVIRMGVKEDDGWTYWNLLTVNLEGKREKDCAFIDTNNNGLEILKWIEDNKLAVSTGKSKSSGYCLYEEYCFDPNILRELDAAGYSEYLEYRNH